MSTPKIEYPYLPEGRVLKYVEHDHPMMVEACDARETLSGDPSYPVGAVLVRDGKVIAKAGNGFNQGRQTHICSRLVQECPSGTGYDLCTLHDSPGHAEQMCIEQARKAGVDTEGADLYLYGHWWACESCWNKMIEAGVRDVYVASDAHIRFARDKVYSAFLTPSSESVYLTGLIQDVSGEDECISLELFQRLDKIICEIGIKCFTSHINLKKNEDECEDVKESFNIVESQIVKCDAFVVEVTFPSHGVGMELMSACKLGKPIILLSKKGSEVEEFVKSIPTMVYHAEYETHDEACKFLKNILKQL